MEGRLIGPAGGREFDGISFDSRAIEGGQLFFALAGETTDGHRFVADAVERGAAAAVVHRQVEPPEGAVLIRVDDTYRALHALTRHVRRTVPRHLVAITGSAGKTTTKELLAAMLGRRFRVAANPGNLNNLFGFPLSLLNIPDDTEWMVAEMGMSSSGELGEISRLGRPDVAVFTNVRPVHLEFFPDLDGIAAAKAELLEGLAEGGLAVINADDPRVDAIGRRHEEGGGRVLRYGIEAAVPVRAADLRPAGGGEPGSRFRLRFEGRETAVELPLWGRHNVENFLAAAAAAAALGVPLDEIAAAVRGAQPPAMRGEIHHLPLGRRGVTLIDDSYNSNPSALASALDGAAELSTPGGRRWAVLGDMLELGKEEVRYHREAGGEAARRGFSPVVGVGELAREMVAGATEAGAEGRWFGEAGDAAGWVAGELEEGDLLLVKGSRGIGLDAVVREVMARLGEGSA